MIKVKVKNYQSIKEVDLEIKGLTLLLGGSNIGKSACQRAIKGLLFNESGDHFVRHKAKYCEVNLQDDTGLNINWEKGPGINKYTVNGEVYDKLGVDSPPIIKTSGYYNLETSDEDTYCVQIADQFDEQFAVTKSGAKFGSLYATITKTDVLNKASTHCNKDLKAKKATQKVRKEDLQSVDKVLLETTDPKEVILEVKDLVSGFKILEEKDSLISSLESLLLRFSSSKQSLDIVSRVRDVEVPSIMKEKDVVLLADLRGKLGSLSTLRMKVDKLSTLGTLDIPTLNLDSKIEQSNTYKMMVSRYSKYSSGLKELCKVSGVDIPTLNVDKKIQDLTYMKKLHGDLRKLGQNYHTMTQNINEKLKQIVEVEEKLSEFKNCPLCGKPLTDEECYDGTI